MKIPQLVQEIIDYYLYLAPWKNGIKKVNTEYNGKCRLVWIQGILVLGHYYKFPFYYNRRKRIENSGIYNPKMGKIQDYSTRVADLPPRYWYSNTKEQLRSLYF